MRVEPIDEPREVILTGIQISEVNQLNQNGENWDADSPPDVFIEFYVRGGDNVYYSDTIQDVLSTSINQAFSNRPFVLEDPLQRIFYAVFEHNEFSIPGFADRVIEAGQRRFFGPLYSVIPDTLVSGRNLKIEWVVDYVY